MPAVQIDTDILVHIIERVQTRTLGNRSQYVNKEHPRTNKKVEPWKWDERTWPDQREWNAITFAPSIWDPESDIPDRFWQSGIGDKNDLVLLDIFNLTTSGEKRVANLWSPQIQHGHYYIYDEEWYLYSDWYQTEYFTNVKTISGQNYTDFQYDFKRGIPIKVRNFFYDVTTGRHKILTEFRKKITFTISGTDPEFVVDTNFTPPRIWLNDDWVSEIGAPIVLVSGIADADDIVALELIGISDGEPNQEFFLEQSPVDRTSVFELWVYNIATTPTLWTTISGQETFTLSGQEVYVDFDIGTIRFGNHNETEQTGKGLIPAAGERIAVHYSQGVAVHYEPINTRDYISARSANMNPLHNPASTGFVSLTTQNQNPDIIILSSELTETTANNFLIEMGNTVGRLTAIVRSQSGALLEGVEVNFELLDPTAGTFGAAATTASAITNVNGEAVAFYNSPPTIDSMGGVTDDITISGDLTTIIIDGLIDPGTTSGLYIYRISEYDLVDGIEDTLISGYYNQYLTDEFITSGNVATQSWEEDYRFREDLLRPTEWVSPDIRTGTKTIMFTSREIMHPHTGAITSAFGPIYPQTIEDQSSDTLSRLQLTYSGITFPIPGAVTPVSEDVPGTKGYLVIGETRTTARAWLTNTRTQKRINSNTITIQVTIPSVANGTFFADTLNDIPSGLLTSHRDVSDIPDVEIITYSGVLSEEFSTSYVADGETYVDWFRRTYKGDSVLYGLLAVVPSGAPAEIPLGWRLKSTGLTVASILDQITYLDLNDTLSSGYFTASGHYNKA